MGKTVFIMKLNKDNDEEPAIPLASLKRRSEVNKRSGRLMNVMIHEINW